jgi:hypothetical protein
MQYARISLKCSYNNFNEPRRGNDGKICWSVICQIEDSVG